MRKLSYWESECSFGVHLQGHQHPDLIEWLRFVDKEFESMLIDAEFISSSEDEPMEDWGEPIEEMHD